MTYKAMAIINSPEIGQAITADEVIETNKSPVFTGLLDATGVKIYRCQEIYPLGFDLTVKKSN